ncbi:MAG: 8-amino-7-oxononanoate synthase, partial [Victivallales bacterium]|nr:8-amino-7-oxononanoate synthase [Victivallales bacterium]
MSAKTKKFEAYLERSEAGGLLRVLRKVTPLSARECLVEDVEFSCLDFSSNNYLGIADHPKLVEGAVEWIRRFGTSSKASRLISGTNPEYIELEERIADWKGFESALLFGSGYMANTGLIPALTSRKSLILADRLNHASLNAGAALSKAEFVRYDHNDLSDIHRKTKNFLDGRLAKRESGRYRQTSDMLIVTDSVFSMDGDTAPISEIARLAEDSNALLYVDDAHATGIFGDEGQGLAGAGDADVVMGTFSKGMGAYGAYVVCSGTLRDYFGNKCGSFIYSTAPPRGVCGAISAAVKLVRTSEFRGIRGRLLERSRWFAREVRALGYDTGNSATPIVPVIFGDAKKTLLFSRFLLENGVLAVAIRPPTVPVGSARLRLSLNAAHTEDDLI